MNVFSGRDSIRNFYDPSQSPPLPLVEIPDHPFINDGVRIYAKMLTMLPAANVKSLPALNMLLRAQEAGQITGETRKIVEYSSGNTVISLGILSRIYGLGSVTAYISNKTSEAKLRLLRFFGLEVRLFGGPAQVEPANPNGGIYAATKDGLLPGYYNPGQYSNDANSEAHVRWTGPQLHSQLPHISIFCASLGTSGTLTGTGAYLRSVNPGVVNLGVFTAPGDRVPGPRPIDLIQSVDLPWKEIIDAEEHVGSIKSYETSLELCRQGLLVGPSSGLALQGLLQYLEKAKSDGRFDSLRDAKGRIPCVFICCDQPFQYMADYFTKLNAEHFPPIIHPELIDVDVYPYGVDCKITPLEAQNKLRANLTMNSEGRLPSPSLSASENTEGSEDGEASESIAILIDLRDAVDFEEWHVPFSLHIELHCCEDPNPFLDPPTLARQWTTLNEIFPEVGTIGDEGGDLTRILQGKIVIVLSYDGNTATVACSVLRKRGVEAHYVVGGVKGWKKESME